MANFPETPLIRVKDAAKILGISAGQLYSLAAPSGPIPCYRIGRIIRFSERDLAHYLAGRRCEPLPSINLKISTQPTPKVKPSDPNGESGLEKLFKKMGVAPKKTPP